MSSIKQREIEGLIRRVRKEDVILQTFLRNHDESLKLANNTFKRQESNLWVVVISYFSMFYLANAYIYSKGYKIGHISTHKITQEVLEELSKNELSQDILKEYSLAIDEAQEISNNLSLNLKQEKNKRTMFQYETTEKIKQKKAKTSLDRAKFFSEKIINLIK